MVTRRLSERKANPADAGALSADRALTVGLVTEGTYPFYPGGVSNWCRLLIEGLPDVRFVVMSIVAAPNLRPIVSLPSNVVSLIVVPLWGVSEVAELRPDDAIDRLLGKGRPCAPQSEIAAFAGTFGTFVDLVWGPEAAGQRFVDILGELAAHLRHYDYDRTMRSQAVWRAFLSRAEAGYRRADWVDGNERIALADVTASMQLLYRWLSVLRVPMPEVDVIHAASAGLASLPGIARRGAAADGDATRTKLRVAMNRDTRVQSRFLLTEHGLYLRERLLGLTRSPGSRFEKAFQAAFVQRLVEAGYVAADLVAPGCHYNQRWETRLGASPSRLRTIYNGPRPGSFLGDERTAVPLSDHRVTMLGRIDPLKDVETLIRAAAVVVTSVPDLDLVIYGEAAPENRWYLERCVALRDQLGLEHNVRFRGYAPSAADAYREGSFVVQSSISEGFPYSVVEAMLSRRAVVATDVGGVGEAVDDCGILVEPRNSRALAEAMRRLLRDPGLAQQLGVRARARAVTHFTAQRCNADYLDSYQALRAGQRPLIGRRL